MKIFLGNSFFYPALGGIENYLLNIGREFIKQGHQVTVFTYLYSNDLGEEDSFEGIRIIRFKDTEDKNSIRFFEPFSLLISFKRKLKEFLDKEKFDLYIARDLYSLAAIHGSAINPNKILYVQATAYPIYARHSYKDRGDTFITKIYWRCFVSLWSIVLGRVEKKYISLSKVVIVLSLSKLKEITNYYNISSNKYIVIPPGVDTSKYYPSATSSVKKYLRSKLGLPINKRIAMYVGRFEREKNPEGILESMRSTPNKSVHIVFVGGFSQSFINKRNEYGLETLITLTGAISEPTEYYRCADFFILPSLTEGFGQVILEAMASGLPVIGFKNPPKHYILANEEIIENYKTGILVDYMNYLEMGNAINYLATNEDECSVMGYNALQFIQNSYTWETTTAKLLFVN